MATLFDCRSDRANTHTHTLTDQHTRTTVHCRRLRCLEKNFFETISDTDCDHDDMKVCLESLWKFRTFTIFISLYFTPPSFIHSFPFVRPFVHVSPISNNKRFFYSLRPHPGIHLPSHFWLLCVFINDVWPSWVWIHSIKSLSDTLVKLVWNEKKVQ